MKNILKNYIFNMVYQILLIGASLILAPYLSRVIGAEGVGIYSYTYSIASIFGIMAHLGITKYGNREIAKCGDDRKKRSEIFAQILFIKLLFAVFVLSLYSAFLHFVIHEYKEAFFWQIFLILSYVLDVTWVFWGVQQFQITTTICSVVKIVSVIAVFAFVHDNQDINLYIALMSFSFFLIQFIPWFFLHRYVNLRISFKYALKRHGKGIIFLFFPVLAKQIYGIMDMVMLRYFTDMEQVGYYQYSGSIITTITCVITALGDVVMPQITMFIHENRSKEVVKLFRFSFHFISFLAVGSMYGLIGVAESFIPFFYGTNFTICVFFLQLFAPLVLFSGYSELIRNSLLLPNYQDQEYVISLSAGVIVNFVGNLLLIRLIGTPGAIIASVLSEITALFFQIYFVRTNFPFLYCVKNGIAYLFLGLPILVVCMVTHHLPLPFLPTIIIDVILGGILYILCVLIYLKKQEPEVCQHAFQYLKKIRIRQK